MDKLSFTGLFFWKSNIPIAIQLSSSVYNATTFKANYLYTHTQNIRTEHQGSIKGKVRAHNYMNVQELVMTFLAGYRPNEYEFS